jgi:hypothetical protein
MGRRDRGAVGVNCGGYRARERKYQGEEGIPDWLCGGDDGWVCGEHYGWEQAGLVWAEVSIKEKGKK